MNVRCPNPRCRIQLGQDNALVGKRLRCPGCGKGFTVMALVLEDMSPEELARARAEQDSQVSREVLPLRLLIENIRSLDNVGSIMRTADATGVEHIYLSGISGRPPNERIAKAALGAQQSVSWSYHASALQPLATAREEGFHTVALEEARDSVLYNRYEYRFPMLLVVGNELTGVSAEVLAEVDSIVSLPMLGIKVSLNVSVATGVALYEIARQALDAGAGHLRGVSIKRDIPESGKI